VDVVLDEARHRAASSQIDHHCLWTDESFDLCSRTDCCDAVTLNGNRVNDLVALIDSNDPPTNESEVGWRGE
jgi:hypothetical protein